MSTIKDSKGNAEDNGKGVNLDGSITNSSANSNDPFRCKLNEESPDSSNPSLDESEIGEEVFVHAPRKVYEEENNFTTDRTDRDPFKHNQIESNEDPHQHISPEIDFKKCDYIPDYNAETKFICCVCYKVFMFKHLLRRHLRAYGSYVELKDPFKCKKCKQFFPSHCRLKHHIILVHGANAVDSLMHT